MMKSWRWWGWGVGEGERGRDRGGAVDVEGEEERVRGGGCQEERGGEGELGWGGGWGGQVGGGRIDIRFTLYSIVPSMIMKYIIYNLLLCITAL